MPVDGKQSGLRILEQRAGQKQDFKSTFQVTPVKKKKKLVNPTENHSREISRERGQTAALKHSVVTRIGPHLVHGPSGCKEPIRPRTAQASESCRVQMCLAHHSHSRPAVLRP